MFGVSFSELVVLGTVALLVLGPTKLPGMLRTLGQWIAKLRRLTTEVRHQSGIDDVLRAEGFEGGLNELRSIMRGGAPTYHAPPVRQPVVETFSADKSREYPPEGPDAHGALPEDLVGPEPGADAPALLTAEAPLREAPEGDDPAPRATQPESASPAQAAAAVPEAPPASPLEAPPPAPSPALPTAATPAALRSTTPAAPEPVEKVTPEANR